MTLLALSKVDPIPSETGAPQVARGLSVRSARKAAFPDEPLAWAAPELATSRASPRSPDFPTSPPQGAWGQQWRNQTQHHDPVDRPAARELAAFPCTSACAVLLATTTKTFAAESAAVSEGRFKTRACQLEGGLRSR